MKREAGVGMPSLWAEPIEASRKKLSATSKALAVCIRQCLGYQVTINKTKK
jgi:hypothetical protein